jgi:hypothetical protein
MENNKPIKIDFTGGHQCSSYQDGDEIVFFCLECDYERRINWKYGGVRLINSGNQSVKHSGFHVPEKYWNKDKFSKN